MKRWIAVLIALVLMLSLAACGGSPSAPNDSKPSTPTDVKPTDPAPSTPDEPTTPEPAKASYVLKDYTVVDDDNCTFIITGVEEEYGQLVFKVYLENKTEDLSLMFSLNDVVVNGYLNDPYWAKQVAAGKKANDSFTFMTDNLESNGLLPIDEMRFNLRVYDYDDWSADNLVDDVFTVYPTGKTADTVTYPERMKVTGEQVVVDNDQGTFVILSADPDGFWGYTINVFAENRTDHEMMVSWDDVSVNGYMMDPFWAVSVPAHAGAYSSINFSDSDFEDNGVESVEEIEYLLKMYNTEDWTADKYVNDSFTFKP